MKPKQTDPQAPEETSANTFATTLAQLGKGNNLAELSSELNRTVMAVRSTGKKGKITYTLCIDPVPGTDGAQVVLTDKIKCETPSPDRKSSLFFTTEEGALTRRDPNQMDWIDQAKEGGGKAVTVAGGAVVTREDLKAATS